MSCQREGWALTAEERRILAKSCWIRAFLGKVCHGTRFSVTHVADVVARNVEVAPGHFGMVSWATCLILTDLFVGIADIPIFITFLINVFTCRNHRPLRH